jgi:hypothetical protein
MLLRVLLCCATGASGATLERAALVFREPTPHAGVLVVFHGPLETGVPNVACVANSLGSLDLHECRPGVPHGEEQFRVINVEACCAVAPIHQVTSHIERAAIHHW